MELCACSAHDLLQSMETPFNEEQISFICRESLKALKLLHSLKKSYKHFKSSKLLFTDKGDVKLGDAITLNTLAAYNKRNSNNLLPYYLSPESITAAQEGPKQEDKVSNVILLCKYK
jgi:serine/threonine protein kinase